MDYLVLKYYYKVCLLIQMTFLVPTLLNLLYLSI